MGLACVEHPLAQGVEQYVGCQSRRKHHGAPLKGGILRLFQVPKLYFAIAGNAMYREQIKAPSPRSR